MNPSITATNEMIQNQKQTIIKIYTDWANHYIKKRYHELDQQQQQQQQQQQSSKIPSKFQQQQRNTNNNNNNSSNNRQLITSLINDLHDGVLLIYLVESVTESTLLPLNATNTEEYCLSFNNNHNNNHQQNQQQQQISSPSSFTLMPKHVNQMINNIDSCIRYLKHLGVNTKGIYAKDIHEGNLKSILTLFFNISRYKQNTKKQQQLIKISNNQSNNNISNNKPYLHSKNEQPLLVSSSSSPLTTNTSDYDYNNYDDHNNNDNDQNDDDYDQLNSGFMTDFSISSSTQSLILQQQQQSSLNSNNNLVNSKNNNRQTAMAPPTTSSVLISRLSNQNQINNNNISSSVVNQTNNNKTVSSKLLQPTTTTTTTSIPGSFQQQQQEKISSNSTNNQRSKLINSKVNNSTPATASTALPQINRINQYQRTTTTPERFNSSTSNNNNNNNTRPSRPQSTSSIPQIGNISSVIKPAVIPTKKSTTNSSSSKISVKNPSKSINNSSSDNECNKQKTKISINNNVCLNNSSSLARLNPSQSELNLRKSSSTSATTIPGKSINNRQLPLRRLPTPSNSNQPRRPISTIIESSIPSMISTATTSITMMTTSYPSATTTTLANGITATVMNSAQQNSVNKPTATVKAMVTPIMSTIDSQNQKNEKQTKLNAQKGIIASTQRSIAFKKDDSNNDSSSSTSSLKRNKTNVKIKQSQQQQQQQPLTQIQKQNSLESTNSNDTIDSIANDNHNNNIEDLEEMTPEIPIPPVMEKPLQTISYLNKSNSIAQTSAQLHHQPQSLTNVNTLAPTAPTIMYRKPENQQNLSQQQQQQYRTGRSHYEPLYSNGINTTNIHRLSQGADYYGSDDNDDSNETADEFFSEPELSISKNNRNHLSNSTTLLNLHVVRNIPSSFSSSIELKSSEKLNKQTINNIDSKNMICKLKNEKNPNRCLDETSSLSSDTTGGGGLNGGHCCSDFSSSSTTTTTTTTKTSSSSSCQSLDPRIQSNKQSTKINHNQSNENKSISKMNEQMTDHNSNIINVKNNYRGQNIINNQNHRFVKNTRLLSAQQALTNDNTLICSDSECQSINQQSQQRPQQSCSTFALYKLNAGPSSSSTNHQNSSNLNSLQQVNNFCATTKDGSNLTNGNNYGELIYSNISSANNCNISRQTTDTDSIESLNTIGSSSNNSNNLYGNIGGTGLMNHLNGFNNNQTNNNHHHHPLSKPGDLICEYESINRLRETMSASPTSSSNKLFSTNTNNNNGGIYSDLSSLNNNNNNANNLGRSGSFRLPGSNNSNNSNYHHLPPIPAHLSKLKQQQQHQNDQSEHSASSLSLLSTNSSTIFTTPEEKYIHEIRRLRRELDQANEKIYTLTSQLTANAHMVAAFEQSLSSMTTRLQQLSSTSELKDNELERLRKTIDVLKKQSGSLMVVNGGNIGVNGQTSHQKSATIMNSIGFINNNDNNGDKFQRYLSSESVNSVSSCGAITDSSVGGGNINAKNKKKTKLKLTGTNTSWIRSSFSRAFKKKSSSNSKTRDTSQNGRDAASDVEMTSGTNQSENEDVHSVPSSPLMSVRNRVKSSSLSSSSSSSKPTIQNHNARSLSESKTSGSDTMVEQTSEPEEIRDLRKQLREKEMQLTDMRLESLTSAHQLENLKEMVNQMRVEMMNLKQDNDRLQRLVHHKSLASSQSSMTSALGSHGSSTLPSAIMNNGSIGNSNGIHGHTTTSMDDSNSYDSFVLDMSPSNNSNSDGSSPKLVTLGSGSHTLATLTVTTKTNWEQLDAIIKKCFKDHLIRVDSSLSLGITVDSLACYRVGSEKILRNFYPINHKSTTNDVPELLPFGYLVDENHINLQFKTTIDSLAFDTLTPKSVLNEFITILIENRRLIFSGPSGTGKTYLAHKLAEYMAIKQMDPNSFSNCNNNLLRFHNANPQHMPLPTGSITTFNIDHKNTKELRAYLMNIAEQCQMDLATITTLPAVIILDNLHHSIDSLEDIFNDIEKISLVKSPYIIGTINQSIHHHHQQMTIFQHYNFHCIMLSVNSEAVRGYLNRYLRRKLLETESKLLLNQQKLQPEISKIIEWIPKVYIHLNKFLENYFGENISIGARLFTSCPIDLNGSQAWFTDLWNYSILPFIIENLREHVRQNNGKLKGKSSSNASIHSFIDPTDWIVANYPWTTNSEWSDHLNRLRPEDIEDDGQQQQPTTNTTNIITSRPSSSNNNYQSFDNNKSVSDQLNKSAKDIKDPFLQMLLKLKEASEYSSQDNQIPNTNN